MILYKSLFQFYGVMGLIYLFLGITWLVMLACNWRDLLRVQFWVGGVIVLGKKTLLVTLKVIDATKCYQ